MDKIIEVRKRDKFIRGVNRWSSGSPAGDEV